MLGADLKYEGHVVSCGLCKIAKHPEKDHMVIWIQKPIDKPAKAVTEVPSKFYVYRQNRRTRRGAHVQMDMCSVHAFLAYADMQYIYGDEVKETERTDRWLDKRNGHI